MVGRCVPLHELDHGAYVSFTIRLTQKACIKSCKNLLQLGASSEHSLAVIREPDADPIHRQLIRRLPRVLNDFYDTFVSFIGTITVRKTPGNQC